jgi:CHAD domain-containing protein
MADGKWIQGLSPEMRVADAARVILAARFEVVRRTLPPAVEHPDDDPEHVHQLRVATRRAGAAVRVFAGCLPKKHRNAAKRYLRAIRRAAGDARDWDVFLVGLMAHQETAPAEAGPALDFLLGYALGERSAAQARLVQAAEAAGPSFAPDTAVLPGHAREPRGEHPPRSLGDLAVTHLGELFRVFNAAVDANPDTPPELHQLRILGKRLRYAIELFVTCFAPPLKEAIYPAVESLQEVLGELQDAAVGTTRLDGLRNRVQRLILREWPRLRSGIEELLEELRQKIPERQQKFGEWRDGWATLMAEYPLESLRLMAAATM